MELLKDYIYKAFDFSGEETRQDYKNMCLLTGGLCIAFLCLFKAAAKIPIIGAWLSLLVLGCTMVVFLPFIAATFRRCGCTERSKWWCVVCVLAGFLSPAILFFVLRRE